MRLSEERMPDFTELFVSAVERFGGAIGIKRKHVSGVDSALPY